MHRTLGAEARHVAIARGITAKKIIHVLLSSLQVFGILRQLISRKQRNAIDTEDLGKTTPSEVTLRIA